MHDRIAKALEAMEAMPPTQHQNAQPLVQRPTQEPDWGNDYHPRQIITDDERHALYRGRRYQNIEREFLDNAPVRREMGHSGLSSSMHDL